MKSTLFSLLAVISLAGCIKPAPSPFNSNPSIAKEAHFVDPQYQKVYMTFISESGDQLFDEIEISATSHKIYKGKFETPSAQYEYGLSVNPFNCGNSHPIGNKCNNDNQLGILGTLLLNELNLQNLSRFETNKRYSIAIDKSPHGYATIHTDKAHQNIEMLFFFDIESAKKYASKKHKTH